MKSDESILETPRATLASLLLLLLITASGAAESSSDTPSSQASPSPEIRRFITVSAAASLTASLSEIKGLFEAANPAIGMNYNFGASGSLEKQIEQGAPADPFLSASAENMKTLVDKGLVESGKQRNLLGNSLVVIIPKGSNTPVKSLTDLGSPSIGKIALGIPESVPAGQYAKEALSQASLWDILSSQLVQAKDVKAVLQTVETGNADAGFVYRTDALNSDKAEIAFDVDASYTPIVYPAGILGASKNPQQAEAFYQFLQSTEALDVFKTYGFTIPQ